jgi:hypothetical protein
MRNGCGLAPKHLSRRPHAEVAKRKSGIRRLHVESLEIRVLLSATLQLMHPTFTLWHPKQSAGQIVPFSSPSATGVTPATMRHAYGVDLAAFGAIAGDGTGQTIAIVDAYSEPTIVSDLAAFDAQFGLPAPPSFTIINQSGGATLPASDVKGGWGVETALDVEWAHVIAPNANILLVEASSASRSNLYAAVDTARKFAGVVVVSMSWGGDELSTDASNDAHFLTPSGHEGVTFVASSGDNGAYSQSGSTTKIVSYPAVSPNVLSVGGTLLTTGAGGAYGSESGWGNGTSSNTLHGSGGGISNYFSQPSYQSGVVTQSASRRTVPDVALDADPNSGVPIYSSYDNGSSTPWLQVGGTSLAAPMWAGVIAIVDQGRALAGFNSLNSATETLPRIYTLPSSDFHDITSGNNGYAAGAGYDLVTGVGTPIVNKVVTDLVGATTPFIGSFTINPSFVTLESTATLTASNVSEIGGTISSVNFYRESNGSTGLQAGSDTFVGAGTQNGATWTISTSTTGLAAGVYTYYAVAVDASGTSSAASSAALTVTSSAFSNVITGTVLAWNTNGQTSFGTQGLSATTVATGAVNSTGLTRGSGVATTSTASSNAWGGNGWIANSAAEGIAASQFVTFGFSIADGYTTSLNSISLNYRRSHFGPPDAAWQYQVNNGAWSLIGDFNNEFSSSSNSGGSITPISLAGISALQQLAAGSVVNFRVVPYNASNPSGSWYVYDGGRNTNDLVITASQVVPGTPTVGGFSASPTSVTAGGSTTLTAANVTEVGGAGTITGVNFYRESNGTAGLQIASDTPVGAAIQNGTTWTLLASTAGLTAGAYTYYAVATDAAGAKSAAVPGILTVTGIPVIGSLSALPATVVSGTAATLTAFNVNATGGSIVEVKFYLESNNTPGLQTDTDTLIGSGAANGATWTIGASTQNLAPGTYTFYAVATDGNGVTSSAASTSLVVTGPPIIGGLSIAPNPVTVGGSTTLTASQVAETGGAISSVNFYLESNGTAGLQIASDTPVGPGVQNGTTWTLLASTAGLTAGAYNYYAVATDANGNISVVQTAPLTLVDPLPATIVARQLFYNDSVLDGNDPAANAADDNAIASDKFPLLSGQSNSIGSVSGYSLGINGLMIDASNLADPDALIANDFEFRVGTIGDPANWALAPAPTALTVRQGEGIAGSDRITLVWADNTIVGTWLRVTFKANSHTGLTQDDVFYFGSLPGDANGDGHVDFADLVAGAQHYGTASGAVLADGDFNGDGMVNFTDLVTLAQQYNTSLAIPDVGTLLPQAALATTSVPIASPPVSAASVSAFERSATTAVSKVRSSPTTDALPTPFSRKIIRKAAPKTAIRPVTVNPPCSPMFPILIIKLRDLDDPPSRSPALDQRKSLQTGRDVEIFAKGRFDRIDQLTLDRER